MTTKRVGRMMEADARKWSAAAGTYPAQTLNQLRGMLRSREYARPDIFLAISCKISLR